jgi:NTE family protein
MLSHPVPSQPLREMGAERVLAVHLRGQWARDGAPRHLFDVIGQSFAIAQDRMAPLWRSAADLVIEPDVAAFEYDDFKRAAELVRAGEEAMRKALPTVRQWLEAPVEATLPEKAAALRNARPAMVRPAPMPAD